MFQILRACLLASLPLCAIACTAAAGGQNSGEAGPSANVDAGSSEPDAGKAGGSFAENYWPKLVVVNGMVNGSSVLGDSAIRICVPDAKHLYPLPDDAPMPEASYPGIERGRGADLGTITGLGTSTTIDIFAAKALENNAAFTASETACSFLECDSGGSCQPHVEMTINFANGPNLLVIRDDPNTPGAITASVGALAPTYDGSANQLTVQVADFSGWSSRHALNTVRVRLGTGVDDGLVAPTLAADSVAPADKAVSMPLPGTAGNPDYATDTLSFEALDNTSAVTDSFSQPLASVAYVSDPATAPSVLFGHRSNVVLVLVGDPTNVDGVKNDAYDPLFDGKALHVVAVPYAPAVPKQ